VTASRQVTEKVGITICDIIFFMVESSESLRHSA
jgi:hypothetical protein